MTKKLGNWAEENGWDTGQWHENVAAFFEQYQDRGLRKWQGFFLSDHTAALKQEDADNALVFKALPKQSQTLVREHLMHAYSNGNLVSVQLEIKDTNGQYMSPIEGDVAGYDAQDDVVIGGSPVAISAIRHVDVLEFKI